MIISRRRVAGWLGAFALSSLCSRWARAAAGQPNLGLNTWSLRELTHDQAIPTILRLMQETGLRDCQLLFSHAEPAEFDPDFGSMLRAGAAPPTPQQLEERKRKSDARTAWRLSVPMSYFEALRTRFEEKGLKIQAYSTPLGSSAEETDRVLLMAKTMGASLVTTRLAEEKTAAVAAAAERHGVLVGIQVLDPGILARQLRVSPQLRANPDIGDLTKAGTPPLEFIQEHLDRISSIDLKDALTGGGSVPFGTGGAHMQQVLELLQAAGSHCTAYIDCDYPGTGRSPDQVKKCVGYVRGVLKQSQASVPSRERRSADSNSGR